MMRLALALCGFLIYFIQAQLLPTIFHTNWLPNLILTIIVMITLFKGRRMGLISAVLGGIVHDVLISNFFGLHLFPYVIVVYLLSAVKHRIYEERWYWSSGIVAICTLLDGIIRSFMILASGGDLHFGLYLWHMVLPVMFWNGLLGAIVHGLLWRKNDDQEGYIW